MLFLLLFPLQYENMMSVLGTWTAKGLPRPAWSNAGGTVRYLFVTFAVLPVEKKKIMTKFFKYFYGTCSSVK